MRRPAKILLLAIIVALLPLHSMAALMPQPCAFGEEQTLAAQSILHAQGSQADTHCPGAVFLTGAVSAPLAMRSDERGIALVERGTRPFFPDKLDRPPLALVR